MTLDLKQNNARSADVVSTSTFPIDRIRFIRYPAFLISTWVIVGFLFQEKFHLSLPMILIFLVAGFVGQISLRKHPYWFFAASFLFWLVLAGLVHFMTYQIPLNYFCSSPNEVISCRGSIQFNNGKYYLSGIESFDGYRPVLLLRSQEKDLSDLLFQRVEITGLYRPFLSCSNPGGVNLQAFWRRQRVFGEIQVQTIHRLDTNSFWNRIMAAMDRARKAFAVHFQDDLGEVYPFFAAMLWGEKDDRFRENIDLLQETGIYHTFCISGLHLSSLGGIVFLFLQRTRLPRLLASGMSVVFCLLYLFFCSISPSAFRAFLMFSLFLAGKQIGRNTTGIHFINVSFLVMFFLQPEIIFQPGSQLSFVSTLAIIFYSQWTQKKFSHFSKITQFVIGGILLPTSVTVFTLPLLIINRLSFSTLIWTSNLSLMPIAQLSIFTNFISGLGGWIPGLQRFFAYPVRGLLQILIRVSIWSRDYIPHLYWEFDIGNDRTLAGVVWILIVFLITALVIRQRKFLLWGGLATISVIFMVLGLSVSPATQVWILDVGQGLAVSCQSGDSAVSIDTGGIIRTYGNTGQSVILPFLRNQGIRTLESVYLTHFHQDHTAGIPPLSDVYSISAIYALTAIQLDGKWITTMIDDPLVMSRLHPFRMDVLPVFGSGKNDQALVYRISSGNFSLLVCGDLEENGLSELMKYGEEKIRSDIIVMPHHGSYSVNLDQLLRRVQPTLAIISLGENRYGHPDQQTLGVLHDLEIPYYRTDRQGAIGFYLTRRDWKVVVNGKNDFSKVDEQ